MQENTTPSTPARYRQWETVTLDRMDGAVVQVRRHTVALYRSKFTGEVVGIVDGQACDLHRAVSILEGADTTTKTAEVLDEVAA